MSDMLAGCLGFTNNCSFIADWYGRLSTQREWPGEATGIGKWLLPHWDVNRLVGSPL